MAKTGLKPTNPYSKFSEAELVRLSKEGDGDAFSFLISKYEITLINFISQYVGVRQDAEDICQESFKRAFIALDLYDPKFAFSTWLFIIARNTAIDHLRKNSQVSIVDINSPSEELSPTSEPVLSPEDEMIGTQTYLQLLEEIERLDTKYKEVAQLRFLNEYAYEEIAKELDIPLNTVRTRLKRAKEILTKKIDK